MTQLSAARDARLAMLAGRQGGADVSVTVPAKAATFR
jgi:hypothetical protein